MVGLSSALVFGLLYILMLIDPPLAGALMLALMLTLMAGVVGGTIVGLIASLMFGSPTTGWVVGLGFFFGLCTGFSICVLVINIFRTLGLFALLTLAAIIAGTLAIRKLRQATAATPDPRRT